MNHMPTPKPKEERKACIECGVSMPIGLVRVVSVDPLKVKCTNEAACRMRQRKRSMKLEPRGRDA